MKPQPNAICTLLPALLLGATALAQAPGANWSLTLNTGNPPVRRENPGAASATAMYVFGGQSGNSGGAPMNDLWSFDGTAWTQLNPDGDPSAPPQRVQAAVAWDFTTNQLVVFGGRDGTGIVFDDTWTWDPTSNTWTNQTLPGGPSARRFVSMAHDPATSSLVLFGGLDAAGNHLNDTWLLTGGIAWTQMSPSNVPSTRRQHHLVSRPDFGDVLMFGGQDATLSSPTKWRVDTWQWSGADWSLIPTTQVPSGQVANDAAYDELRQRVVLAGGNGTGGQPTGIISEFDSITNDWVLRPTDPGIFKVSRYFAGYISSLGKTYKVSGQALNPLAPNTNTYEFQSDVVAATTSYGSSCTGPGGALTLAADNLPWTERTFSATCTNLGTGSLALGVFGTSMQSTPLSPLLPQAGAGCLLLNDAAVLTGPSVVTTGEATVTLPIPADPMLAGLNVQVQVAELVFTGAGWTGLHTSNGLDLTIGAL
ncbi:MAG: kelch repeat-containing protein [Planctomycetota bacterium]